jgi:hypothetical protein
MSRERAGLGGDRYGGQSSPVQAAEGWQWWTPARWTGMGARVGQGLGSKRMGEAPGEAVSEVVSL